MPELPEPRHNAAPPGLLDRLLAGADLRIFLKPDATIRSRRGTETYIESLDLPHIIVNGDHFWGCQRNLVVNTTRYDVARSFYAYYSGFDIFANSGYETDSAAKQLVPQISQIMSTGRYERLEWRVADTFTCVYDSEAGGDVSAYIDAVERGCRFKAAIDFFEGHTQIHPVIYPFYYPDGHGLEVQTEIQFFPEYMRHGRVALVEKLLGQRIWRLDDHRDPEKREENHALEIQFFCSYFKLFEKARGQRIYDTTSGTLQDFRRMRLFAAE